MLLIDHQAEVTLAAALEALKAEPTTARCIYLHLMDRPAVAAMRDVVLESATQHIAAEDTHIYFCEDGDICVLASALPSRDAHLFMLDIADLLKQPVDESWVSFYETGSGQMNHMIATVDAKLEKRRALETAKHALAEQQLHERKRQAILSGGAQSKSDEINRRRATRAKPELMMIEDDAFSRKLVENVLQKKYALTAIGEPTHALDIYARLAPNVLFLDINLPDVTGHELLEKILLLDPKAYVVMLSGNADQANIAAAISKGARGFIAKPFTREKLFQYLERCPTLKQFQA